jgi:hypothetical protein
MFFAVGATIAIPKKTKLKGTKLAIVFVDGREYCIPVPLCTSADKTPDKPTGNKSNNKKKVGWAPSRK